MLFLNIQIVLGMGMGTAKAHAKKLEMRSLSQTVYNTDIIN